MSGPPPDPKVPSPFSVLRSLRLADGILINFLGIQDALALSLTSREERQNVLDDLRNMKSFSAAELRKIPISKLREWKALSPLNNKLNVGFRQVVGRMAFFPTRYDCTEEEARILIEVLKASPNLEFLSLKHLDTNHDEPYNRAIIESLEGMNFLKTIDFSDCHFGDFDYGEIARIIPSLRRIEHINLSRNHSSAALPIAANRGDFKLLQALGSHPPTIKTLWMAHCFKTGVELKLYEALTLGGLDNLESLNLSGWNVNSISFKQIVKQVGIHCKNLKYFNLAQNMVTDTIPLAVGVPLGFGNQNALNEFSDFAVQLDRGETFGSILQIAFSKMPNLRTLDMSFCIQDDVLRNCGDAFSRIEDINLWGCKMTTPVFGQFLQSMSSLRKIVFMYNDFTIEDLRVLLPLLPVSLLSLRLSDSNNKPIHTPEGVQLVLDLALPRLVNLIDIDREFIYEEKQKNSDLYVRYLQVLKDRNITQSTSGYNEDAEWRSLPELGGGARKVVHKSRSVKKSSSTNISLVRRKTKLPYINSKKRMSLELIEGGAGSRKKCRSYQKRSKKTGHCRNVVIEASQKSKRSKKYSPSMLKWKKYTSRKSPGLPANHHCGEVRRGNDGNLWESKMNKNGICAWKSFK